MAKPPTAALSPDNLATLQNYSNLLHLLHHRNNNQHRRSPWYRHFSTFRRHLSRLLSVHTSLCNPPASHYERTIFLKTRKPQLETRLAQELDLWTNVLVPKWQRSFSQVVADGRFAVIGLVLMGALAGVSALAGVTGRLEEAGQGEVERVLEEFGREAGELGLGGLGDRQIAEVDGGRARNAEVDDLRDGIDLAGGDVGEVIARDVDADEGEAVSRDEIAQHEHVAPVASVPPPEHQPADSMVLETAVSEAAEKPARRSQTSGTKRRAEPKVKAPKKKRKKGNAIDDLFSGL